MPKAKVKVLLIEKVKFLDEVLTDKTNQNGTGLFDIVWKGRPVVVELENRVSVKV